MRNKSEGDYVFLGSLEKFTGEMRGRREEGRYFEFFRLQGIEEKVEDGHDRLRRGMKESRSMDQINYHRCSRSSMQSLASVIFGDWLSGKSCLFIIHLYRYCSTASQNENEYVNEVIFFRETLLSTTQQTLTGQVVKCVLQDVLSHIPESIVNFLVRGLEKRFILNVVVGLM
ncbi:exocyst complex component SEC15B [Tanacetum coccineum]